MIDAAERRMTADEFFRWQALQDKNYELVDDFPYSTLKAMAGATLRHDRVTTNAIVALGVQLRGKPCRPNTADAAVVIPRGNIRRPDLLVDCGPRVDAAMEAQDPRLVVEVLSPSTTDVDRFRKLEEYRSHPSIALILLVETTKVHAALRRRTADGWIIEDYSTLDDVISMPEIGADLSLADLYQDLTFEA